MPGCRLSLQRKDQRKDDLDKGFERYEREHEILLIFWTGCHNLVSVLHRT